MSDGVRARVWTLGYRGRTPAELKTLVEGRDALLFDIRFNPASRAPQWSYSALRRLLGDRYRHLHALGNRNYKSGGEVALVDYAAGRAAIEAANRPVILMCGCEVFALCHRSVVADLLRRDGWTVEEIDRDDPLSE